MGYQLFFAVQESTDILHLSADESRHACKVLRHKQGDRLHCIDGKGNLFQATIESISDRETQLRIDNTTAGFGIPPCPLHLAVAILRNPDRFEWLVEKAIEIGVTEITPLITERTEKKRIHTERLRKIALAALKQSQRALMSVINEPVSLKGFLKNNNSGQCFIAHCDTDAEKKPLHHCIKPGIATTLLIGPEGDFSPAEIILAKEKGFVPVMISPSTLRTETAAVVCCQIVAQVNMQ